MRWEDEADEVLAEQAKTNPVAFGVLYERHLSAIYSYVYHRTGSAEEAQDLTARTFFNALKAVHRYQPRGVRFSAWLFRIAHNLLANWYRDTQRRRTVGLDNAAELSSVGDDPVVTAEMREERESLLRAVKRLSRERQHLLVLKFASGLSNAEIGTVMGRSEGAVKALLHRTMESLRQIVAEEEQRSGEQRHCGTSSPLASETKGRGKP